MKVGEFRKLTEDAPEDAEIHFFLGDHCTPLAPYEQYMTGTKDAAYIEFAVPEGWERT